MDCLQVRYSREELLDLHFLDKAKKKNDEKVRRVILLYCVFLLGALVPFHLTLGKSFVGRFSTAVLFVCSSLVTVYVLKILQRKEYLKQVLSFPKCKILGVDGFEEIESKNGLLDSAATKTAEIALSTFEQLPKEIQKLIFLKLDIRDLNRLSQSCRNYNTFVNSLWSDLIKRDFQMEATGDLKKEYRSLISIREEIFTRYRRVFKYKKVKEIGAMQGKLLFIKEDGLLVANNAVVAKLNGLLGWQGKRLYCTESMIFVAQLDGVEAYDSNYEFLFRMEYRIAWGYIELKLICEENNCIFIIYSGGIHCFNKTSGEFLNELRTKGDLFQVTQMDKMLVAISKNIEKENDSKEKATSYYISFFSLDPVFELKKVKEIASFQRLGTFYENGKAFTYVGQDSVVEYYSSDNFDEPHLTFNVLPGYQTSGRYIVYSKDEGFEVWDSFQKTYIKVNVELGQWIYFLEHKNFIIVRYSDRLMIVDFVNAKKVMLRLEKPDGNIEENLSILDNKLILNRENAKMSIIEVFDFGNFESPRLSNGEILA